jgi:hypothetical protein
MDRGRIEKIPYKDVGTFCAEFIGPRVDLSDECADRYALLEQLAGDTASGRPLLTTGCSCNQYWIGHGEFSLSGEMDYVYHLMDACFYFTPDDGDYLNEAAQNPSRLARLSFCS